MLNHGVTLRANGTIGKTLFYKVRQPHLSEIAINLIFAEVRVGLGRRFDRRRRVVAGDVGAQCPAALFPPRKPCGTP